uniref:Chromatin licensing and DNA replication factor 1 n=1 Tax=Cynoglossus semilaevis TaxID=244447 RepID=A0A3P8WNI6_CYNSE
MSQARVTDFFSQRKRGPVKAATKQRSVSSTRTRSAKSREPLICSSSVHEEFVRVIDEAVGSNNETSSLNNNNDSKHRSSAEFDIGAGVTTAAAEHSTAKKRRQTETKSDSIADTDPERGKRRTARKKLLVRSESVDTTTTTSSSEKVPEKSVVVNKEFIGQGKKVKLFFPLWLSLVRVYFHGDLPSHQETTRAASVCTSTTLSSSSSSLSPAGSSTSEEKRPLAAKAQRRQDVTEERGQSETQAQDSVEHPAYQRYHTLAQAVPPGLSLPYQYKVLAEMFRSMDTVVAMLYNRCETATFARVKQGVQDMMKKRFEENHVGQIKTVFPECYTLRREKNIPTFNSSIKRGSYQLTIEPIILSDQKEARPLLSASRLLERRRVFHGNMVKIVKQHHKEFLSSLVPPVSVPDDKLTRWHPRFNVDTVPAVPVSPLPQPPNTEKLSTAQEVLDKARSLITPKMEKALVSLTLKSDERDEESRDLTTPQKPDDSNTVASTASAAQVPAALKGVPQSLLDRIRAKEAQKLQASMMRNPVQEERLLMMSRLEELSRILRTVFVAEKRPALIMEVACNRMMASYRSALSEMEKHLRLLAEVAGDWLTIHPIRKDFYLKINKNMELSSVLEKLNKRLKEEERL